MSRTGKGPRLWKRPARKSGGRSEAAVWIIRDGGRQISTGCAAQKAERSPPAEAEKALAEYIEGKFRPRRRPAPSSVSVAQVLSVYLEHRREKFELEKYKRAFDGRIGRLNSFFGSMPLDVINPTTCNAYVSHRAGSSGARVELKDLQAAINHYANRRLVTDPVKVTLPPPPVARERWLTRSEVARLLWVCWRHQELQTIGRGDRRGQKLLTRRHPLRHVARFILIGVYTGSRSQAISSASTSKESGHSFIDLENGIFHRRATGRRATAKGEPLVRLPPRLVAHLRRWKARSSTVEHFVQWGGSGVGSVRHGFARAVQLAGLSSENGKVTPHTLRHTAATWLMQQGVSPWDAAHYLGMSVAVMMKVYAHHHPDHFSMATQAINSKGKKTKRLVGELVGGR